MMSKVTFYEERNFQGRSYECMSDCGDFSSYMNRCHSCRVESGCWMMYDQTNYMGNGYFFRRGEYADYMSMFGMNSGIRSCRMIPMHRGSYRMRIYERDNFMGQMYEMMDDCENVMDRYRMSHCQSCHVMDGHWLMYDQPNYRGRMSYFGPGEYRNFSNYGGMRFMSMRRIMDSWGSYRMRIYERDNFMGQMYEMMDDCENVMDRYRMSHCQSCHMMDGHWLFYDQPNYRGRMSYFGPGQYRNFSNMGGMRFMSMRRIMHSWY